MAIYNTSSDSSNTAVRAFLTKVGEYYWGESFNTGSGKGKQVWNDIKKYFDNTFAYCGSDDKLQIEHLLMFNRSECGLHHPGNVVPCCNKCNKRTKKADGTYNSWIEHLVNVCPKKDIEKNKLKIEYHIYNSKYKYPKLTDEEVKSIKVISNSLYENIKIEIEKSLRLYKELDESFVKQFE